MASETVGKSIARQHLDHAMGKAQASLKAMATQEFDDLIKHVLREVPLRELEGFHPLKAALQGTLTPGVHFWLKQPALSNVEVPFDVSIDQLASINPAFTIDTKVLEISERGFDYKPFFRRYESEETTDDLRVAEKWGKWSDRSQHGYVYRMERKTLVWRQPPEPPDFSGAAENLFEIKGVFEKVPHQNTMVLVHLYVRQVPVGGLRLFFEDDYADMGEMLIKGANRLVQVKLESLKAATRYFERGAAEMDRLARSIQE